MIGLRSICRQLVLRGSSLQGGVCLMCTASKGLSRVLSTGEVPNEACRKKKCTSQKRKVLTDSSKVKKKR